MNRGSGYNKRGHQEQEQKKHQGRPFFRLVPHNRKAPLINLSHDSLGTTLG
jgi:hypothetical protein